MAILWRASAATKKCRTNAACVGGRETTATLGLSTRWLDDLVTRSGLTSYSKSPNDSSADWIDTNDGHRVLNGAHVNRARLMIDTRKWLLSKMLPKVYGDHLTVAGDPDQPIRHVVQRIDWNSLSDEELEAIEAFALAAQQRLNAARKNED